MEWTVVTVIVALVGLFLTLGKPIINLNSNIVKLNATLESHGEKIKNNEDELKEQKLHAHESHQRLWAHNNKQDEQLSDHEQRIHDLEHK